MPKVSIVMPTYKNLNYLKRAIKSVLMQSYKDYEIIITDDSQNNVIKNYIRTLNNPRIRYFNNKPQLYQAANHTSGLQKATGKYIKILHDDDYFITNNALEKMVLMLDNNSKYDFVYSNNIQVDLVKNKVLKKRHAQKYLKYAVEDPLYLLIRNTIGAPSVILLRNYQDTFFDSKMKKFVDTDFYINYLLKHPNIGFIKDYLIAIGENPEQDTHKVINDKDLVIRELVYLYQKYEMYINKSKNKKDIETYIKKMIKSYEVNEAELIKILSKSVILVRQQEDFVNAK